MNMLLIGGAAAAIAWWFFRGRASAAGAAGGRVDLPGDGSAYVATSREVAGAINATTRTLDPGSAIDASAAAAYSGAVLDETLRTLDGDIPDRDMIEQTLRNWLVKSRSDFARVRYGYRYSIDIDVGDPYTEDAEDGEAVELWHLYFQGESSDSLRLELGVRVGTAWDFVRAASQGIALTCQEDEGGEPTDGGGIQRVAVQEMLTAWQRRLGKTTLTLGDLIDWFRTRPGNFYGNGVAAIVPTTPGYSVAVTNSSALATDFDAFLPMKLVEWFDRTVDAAFEYAEYIRRDREASAAGASAAETLAAKREVRSLDTSGDYATEAAFGDLALLAAAPTVEPVRILLNEDGTVYEGYDDSRTTVRR